jgi:mitotic spindle assembly checkpoint protein MAD2B
MVLTGCFSQGNVDKVVVVIKDKEQVALERFMFSVQTMIQVEPFNKDTR